jgi:hypothetical protein
MCVEHFFDEFTEFSVFFEGCDRFDRSEFFESCPVESIDVFDVRVCSYDEGEVLEV